MRVYLDVSCLDRPYDDQAQPRIREETRAVLSILAKVEAGEWALLASEMVEIEIAATLSEVRRERLRQQLRLASDIMRIDSWAMGRGRELERWGFKAADAVHVAMAEHMRADVLLSCDDRLCRISKRHRSRLTVRVVNPVEWLKEQTHGTNT